ncbi:MAG: hypothetical protein M1829_004895 [Trizodia sp. TS-e1964]|nr:MAG: hypothetical protein M1829_004895 [Trizodia sp. TS-e1964]
MASTKTPPAETDSPIHQFKPEKLLNQDQAGRRITLYGTISSQPALLIVERTAFSIPAIGVSSLSFAKHRLSNLGANDIYFWYLGWSPDGNNTDDTHADVKLNLIWPCTEKHIRKYSIQGARQVTETPEIYANAVRPFIEKKREAGNLNWVWNIIEGRTEQEQVLYRSSTDNQLPLPSQKQESLENEGFLVLPDLNWDRMTLTSLHLLGLVERRDIWSVRDLRKKHTAWLHHMRRKLVSAAVALYANGPIPLEADQLKLYVHYQPTYYHFHVHIVHIQAEPGFSQATGKALGLENIISILEGLAGGPDAGIQDLSLTYTLGEASELWLEVFEPLKAKEKAEGGV